ncbi:MAG: STAS domain-containing protein [Phycisphaerales bacterium]|nr:STAS domain-containing protein [Phycisphaerales bacterium]
MSDGATAGAVQIVKLPGDLRDGDCLSDLFSAVTGASTRLVLDLSDVTFVSSAGLGALVRLVAYANTLEARVALAAPSPFVANLLQVTHLSRFFEIHAGVEAAAAAIGG